MALMARLGQLLLSGIFIKAGFDAARAPGGRTKKAETVVGPERAELAVRANGAAMVAGGLALALDVQPRLAALGLMAAMVPTTLAGHAFWNEETPAGKGAQQIQFLKNLGLIGGLLFVITQRRR
jgi:uncharacterized membrane protein YphA (DoxX/SURF4 family)